LQQLFIYRRLKRPRRPKDPTDTIRHLVEVMLREVPLCQSLCRERFWTAVGLGEPRLSGRRGSLGSDLNQPPVFRPLGGGRLVRKPDNRPGVW
jgi:hypothetical protein